MSFIGIAINIWSDTFGVGGAPPPGEFILDAQNIQILDAQGDNIEEET